MTRDLVLAGGVQSVTTRAIAVEAGIPVASLYQYFADREAILLALIERDVEEIDSRVADGLANLEVVSAATITSTVIGSYVSVFRRRPAYVMVWLRGRTNEGINEFSRERTRAVSVRLFEFASSVGALKPSADTLTVQLAVEMGDRLLQMAFEDSLQGDQRVLDEAVELISGYLERHCTPEGVTGIRR